MNVDRRRSLSLAVCVLLSALLVCIGGCARKGTAQETSNRASESDAEPIQIEQSATGETIVALNEAALATCGLVLASPIAREWPREIEALGWIEVDPSRVHSLRAPVAGDLVLVAPHSWPQFGALAAAGESFAGIVPRITAIESADLSVKLSEARASRDAATALVEVARSSFERVRKLNAQDKAFSDEALQQASARLEEQQAQLRATQDAVALYERLSNASSNPGSSTLPLLPLSLSAAGVVVASDAHPGEHVESGQEILRVADFAEVFARVQIPIGASIPEPGATVRIVPTGETVLQFEGTVVGPPPIVERAIPSATLLVRVRNTANRLRPGNAVTAWLALASETRSGFEIARGAVLRFAGRSWVYVEVGPGRLVRRAVEVEPAPGDATFCVSGLAAEARVVVVGAQSLLSHEQMHTGGGAAED